jgi:hypothetical protein
MDGSSSLLDCLQYSFCQHFHLDHGILKKLVPQMGGPEKPKEVKGMPRTTRHQIVDRAEAALAYIDSMDLAIMDIEQLAAGRQPALDEYKIPLLEMHNILRQQWRAFRLKL